MLTQEQRNRINQQNRMKMTPERRKQIAAMGGKASGKAQGNAEWQGLRKRSIVWASWRVGSGLGFKIPFTSERSALRWLAQRHLLRAASLTHH